jgi:AP2-associated kinase
LSALSFSGTKNMLSGRFNDAFKRFEQTGGEVKTNKSGRGSESGFRTPSPNPAMQTENNLLSPISGSVTDETPRRPEPIKTDLGDLIETEDLPPEMRREMERLQLAQEEKRVAAATAEHRSRGGAPPVPSKANMIQQRVQSLLDDGQKSPVRKRQAEGYGRYTERTETAQPEQRPAPTAQATTKRQAPPVARKPATPVPAAVTARGEVDMNLRYHKVRQSQSFPIAAGTYPLEHSVSAPAQRTGAVPRPNAPAKPAALKTGGSAMSQGRPQSSGMASPVYSQPSGAIRGPSLAALIARDNEGVAGVGAGSNSGMEQGIRQESDFANQSDFDDWQADFSKRYPSLSGIEMVEREIAGTGGSKDGGRRGMRIRDV